MPDLSPRTPIADAPLSVILLAAADSPELEDVVAAWSNLLDELARPAAEILLVQDAALEAAVRRAQALAERFPRLQVLATDQGEGAALQAGILAAQHPLVAIAPADKQYQPAELKRLLEHINQVDFVTGYRVYRPVPAWLAALDFLWHWLARIFIGYSTERRDAWLGWSGWGRRWLARWIFGLRVNDADCPFRLARRELFRRIPVQSRSSLCHFEVLAKANHLGAWMAQVPVTWVPSPRAASVAESARQQRTELRKLFTNPDFNIVPLKEPLTWMPPSSAAQEPPPADKMAVCETDAAPAVFQPPPP
jgi:hypothetical protein